MKHIKLFQTQTDFDNKNLFLSIPNVSLLSDTNKLIYNFEKIITIGGGGNFTFGGQCYCSIDDLWIDEPVSNLYGRQFKTNQQFISQKELSHSTISSYLTILDRDNIENKLLLFYKSFVSGTNKYVIENNTLTVSDDLGIVTKIEFNGLKRKDNGQRDFIGQMTSYLDKNGNPFIIENKTVERDDAYRRKVTQFVTKEFSDYENDYSPDNKIKLFLWNNDHL
jgi:hypothetical protein